MNKSIRKDLIETIKYHIENKMIINIIRDFSTEIYTGFPLLISDDFLLITNVYDFFDNGYTILRLVDISDAYSKESEVFYESICIAEGLQDKAVPYFCTDISSLWLILEQLRRYEGYISIQCEKQVKDGFFYMGNIIKIEENQLYFVSIGTDGKWEDEPCKILFDDITQICFGDNYSMTYYKYTKHA